MPAHKKPIKPRTRYYVDKPVIVLGIDEYERLLTQLVRMSMMEKYDAKVQSGLKSRNTILLKEGWENLKKAKEHYKIPT